MHYYTRFKNHEHSYKVTSRRTLEEPARTSKQNAPSDKCPVFFSWPQLEQKLLKTAKEKMEQLSRAFICRKCLTALKMCM